MMKKTLVFVMILVSMFCLVACNKEAPAPAPKLTNEMYTGKITEITDTTITIISNVDGNKEISFLITNLATIDMPSDLVAGDTVTIETAYIPGTKEPYPAIRIVKAGDSSIK